MRCNHIVLLSALLLSFTSCRDLNVDEVVVPVGKVILKAGVSGTRTSLDSLSVVWNNSDSFSLFSSEGNNNRFTLVSGVGTSVGTFSGNVSGSAPYYALYPYSQAAGISDGKIHFKLPSVQTYQYSSFGSGANPMIASIDSLSSIIFFRNLCGVLRLKLRGTATVTRIEITDSGNKFLWGNATLDLDGTEGSADQKMALSGGDSTIVLDCGEGVALSNKVEGVDFNVVLPVGSLANGFSVKLYFGDTLIDSFGTSKAGAGISRANIIVTSVKTVHSNLGADETANSYIVYEAGSYKFPTVSGNSAKSIEGIASAKVIWESNGTTTAPNISEIIDTASVKYSKGFVCFETLGRAGNALIAALDEDGAILWSWHIWIPSSHIARGRLSSMTSGSIMDRNLGALTSDKADPTHNGLLYQWGRKDPFPGLAIHSSGQKLAAATASFTKEASSSQTGTQAYAAAHPTVFITNSVSPKNWVVVKDNSFWSETKTLYDPCPPGYHVPSKGILTDLTGNYESSSYGWTIDGMWFPFSGCRWNDGSSHASTAECDLWTCTPTSGDGVYRFVASTTALKCSSFNVLAYAMGIRCVSSSEPTPKGKDEHDFFKALPEGAEVTGISIDKDEYTVSFSSGESFVFDRNDCGHVCVSADGYWKINGVKTKYPFAAENHFAVGGDGIWKRNGVATGERATPANKSAGEFDIYVTNVIERARTVEVNFSDGTSLKYGKKLQWQMRVEKTEKDMYVYMGHEGSQNWVRYRFCYRYKNVDNATTYPNRYDNWGLGQPARCSYDGSKFTLPALSELFLNGESEAAVQVTDANGGSTYTGGTLHGWENILQDGSGNRLISIKVDGVKIGEKDEFSLRQASRIDIEQQTRIAMAYGDPVKDQYATVVKRWTIKDGTVTIYDEYSFTSDIKVKQAMFGMFCVKRIDQSNSSYASGAGADPSLGYITNLAWKDNDRWNVYAMNEGWNYSTHQGYNARSKDAFFSKDLNTSRVEEYGEKGWTFAMQLDSSCVRTGGGFQIGTNGNNYNKIYFDICGNRSMKAGEVLYSTIHWEIDNLADWSMNQ